MLGISSQMKGAGGKSAEKFANVSQFDVELVTKGAVVDIKGVDQKNIDDDMFGCLILR